MFKYIYFGINAIILGTPTQPINHGLNLNNETLEIIIDETNRMYQEISDWVLRL